MIFNTVAYYALFLLPAAILYRAVALAFRPQVCVVFGGAFFVYFSITAVGGIAGACCLLLFLWEALFSRVYRPGSRWCLAGVACAVAVLAAFKYWNFLVGLAIGQGSSLHWAGVFLPLGISFFTFEFIHYAVDRRKGTAEPGSWWDYLAFILFFPTMVAGPIKRFQDFLPALRAPSTPWAEDWRCGVTRILCGLAKKFAIADVLTSFTDHLNHADIAAAERWVLPVWLLAYGMKIYCDFSAYSDIAIGSARLFGIRVPENFDWPYLQANIADFWRHWHISLSKWLTDYVFIPLGGSRVSAPAVYRNVLVTMLVSGVWHGAGLNFVVWGLWHGLLLCAHRLWTRLSPPGEHPSRARRVAGWALTFVCVNAGWAVFCMDLPTALHFAERLFGA
ncbi:MAG: MBOAT family protein [Planctomycetes bacterium]|nr:MBOAT family protein [Planctomycetota bacterium]